MDNAVYNENGGGPWGSRGGSGGGSGGKGGSGGNDDDGLGPRNPWSQPPRKRPPGGRKPGPSALDELLRKGRERIGQGGGGMPSFGGRPAWVWAIAALVLIWLIFTSVTVIGPQQRGVVTFLGRYSRTLGPGMQFKLPAPIEFVQKLDVDNIHLIDIDTGAGNQQNLVLTGDQNIVDLAYSVRWNIRDPELYLFELADPEDTIREVAESAMREALARVTLNDAIGPQRSQIEDRVAARMQQLLDSYRAGVAIQGVAIKQADPPSEVSEAFKQVSAAQQEAQSYLNQARAYAQATTARAQGEAAAFDRVYAQYKLSPQVTRRRMYYETMERVLAKTDKTIVEARGVNSYLPLTQLPRAATVAPQAQGTSQ